MVQLPNFPTHAIDIIPIVYAHVILLLSRLKSVYKPESVKYWMRTACEFERVA
jgi:hypothetical protein